MFKIKVKYIILFILILLVEVYIALYVNDRIIRPHIGDFLVVILIYCFLRGIFNIGVYRAAISTIIFSYIVEFMQYLHIVEILGLEKNRFAAVIIGNSFSWVDLICYTLGILFVLLVERKIIFRK
jgi:hypothetical protein